MRIRSVAGCLRSAFLLTLAQILFLWILAPSGPGSAHYQVAIPDGFRTDLGSNFAVRKYLRMNNWDSLRFFEIARNGYHLGPGSTTLDAINQYRVNLTAPPVYPTLVYAVENLSGIPGEFALLFVSQFACFIFWSFFLIFLQQRGIEKKRALRAAIFLAVYPGTFYLVVGYTESVFMAAFFGFLLFVETGRFFPAAISGVIATASRIAGIPMVIFPVLRKLSLKSLLLAGVSSLGLVGFFFLCQRNFGQWNIYFDLGRIAGQKTNFGALLDPRTFFPLPSWSDTMVSINHGAVWFALIFFVAAVFRIRKRDDLALGITALIFFLLAVSAKVNADLDGMVRYSLPVVALLTVIYSSGEKSFSGGWVWIAGFLAAVQTWVGYRFLIGHYVS